MTETLPVVTAGFLPLTDALPLLAAEAKGFARAEGFRFKLTRETSWANIRDRIGVGHFDVSHMLAPMAIAANLGLYPLKTRILAPLTLGHGGNAITVSTSLWAEMEAQGAPSSGLDAGPAGAALARVVHEGSRRLRFAAVHQNSSHNYELRYWLAASGIMPDTDVEIVILPPPLLPDALGSGGIDGYCVGEPWNSIGVEAGVGRIVTTKSSIWPKSPDKVLGVRQAWAEANPLLLAAMIRALVQAARWCGNAQHWTEAADLLAVPQYLDAPSAVIVRALQGRLRTGGTGDEAVEQFYVPHAGGANLPSPSDAAWYYTQMVRWGEVMHRAEAAGLAVETFRPDLYREALSEPEPQPSAGKITRPPFFDGVPFDDGQIDTYIAAQASQ